MQDIFNRLLGGTFVYSIGGIINGGISFLLLLLTSHYIAPHEFGILSIVLIFQVFLELYTNLGISGVIVQIFFKNTNSEEKKQIINTCHLFTLFCGLFFGVVLYLLRVPLAAELISPEDKYIEYFLMVLGIALFQNALGIRKNYLKIQEKPKTYVAMDLGQNVLRISFILYFLNELEWGLYGYLLGGLIANMLTFIWIDWPLFRYLKAGLNIPKLKEILLLSLPINASWIVGWLIQSIDRFFLKYFTDLTQVGLYSFALRISSFFALLLVRPISAVWPTLIFSTENRLGVERVLGKALNLYAGISLLFYLAVVSFSKDIFYFLAPEKYLPSLVFVPLLAIIPVLEGSIMILSTGARLIRKNSIFLTTSVSTLFIVIGLNFVLGRLFGAYGIALATVFANLFWACHVFYLSQKAKRIPFEWEMVPVSLFCVAAIIFLFPYYIDLDTLASRDSSEVLLELLGKTTLFAFLGWIAWKKIKKLKSEVL